MSQEECEIASNMDLADWGEATFNEKEIPLADVIDIMKEEPNRLILHRSKQYPNSCMLWDSDTEDVVIVTYAFVVKYSSPLQTGNFVPDQYDLPEGMFDYLRKTEPGPMAQISVTYDCRMDEKFVGYLQFLEDWVLSQTTFDPGKRSRNSWMSPSYVTNNFKYTMTSQLFQSKTAFNCKQDGYSVNYPVHEWIEEHCYPHNPSWIPNPNVVQFFELRDGVLKDMRNTDDSTLRGGDMVKTTFKIVATNGRDTWNMGLIPIQVVRVGKIDRSSMAPFMQLEDHKPVEMHKDGDRVTLSKRQRLGFRQGSACNEDGEDDGQGSIPPTKRKKPTRANRENIRPDGSVAQDKGCDLKSSRGGNSGHTRTKGRTKESQGGNITDSADGEHEEGEAEPSTSSEGIEPSSRDDMYDSSDLTGDGDSEGTCGVKTVQTDKLPPVVAQLLKEVFSGSSQRSNADKNSRRTPQKTKGTQKVQRRSSRIRK